jgi:hypothetical protein
MHSSQLLAIPLAALLLACSNDPETCSDEVTPSAVVKVVDGTGKGIPDAKVTYVSNGAATQTAACDDPAGKACTAWSVYTDAGSLLLRAASADGSKNAQVYAAPVPNGCAAAPQTITLTLP